MYALIDAAVARTRTSLLIMFMVLLAGIVSLNRISIESDPHIEVPVFLVSVINDGISQEDAERLLVVPLELELRRVEGVKELTAYASENIAQIVVEFDADYDLDSALIDVREAVDRAKPEIPDTAEEPVVREMSTADFPILQINFVGQNVPERVLYNIALEVRNEIEELPEVMDAQLQGNREEVLEAVIDPVALESYRISGEELINIILRNNRLIPAGNIDTGEGRFSIKVPAIIEDVSDIVDLPLKVSGDRVVTLPDVATVRRTFKDRSTYARVNGNRTISLNVIKRAGANVIETVNRAKVIVERYRPNLPGKVDVFYTQDQAPLAQRQVTELQGNIITALVLVMVLVVAAMGLRSGIIVGMGIPVTFLFSLIILNQIGYSFNFMVMFGMLLALGMLIDGAIVVTEYADRKMVEGMHRRQGLCERGKTYVLARSSLRGNYPGGFFATDVLAWRCREVHALSSGYRIYDTLGFPFVCIVSGAGTGRRVRKSRFGQWQKCTDAAATGKRRSNGPSRYNRLVCTIIAMVQHPCPVDDFRHCGSSRE